MQTVSIIIPVYNGGDRLSKCIESILVNTYQDSEIFLINDGSTDDSWRVIDRYAKKYPDRIRVFDQENQGVALARNIGMQYTTSKYIMFIDQDDSISADYLERFVTAIEKDNLDVVIGGYRRTTERGILFEMRLQDMLWARYMIMAPWAKIYRRDFLVKNEIKFLDNNIGEDVYFNLQVINLTKKITILDYCGYNWFYNELSVSNTNQKTIKSGIRVMTLLDSTFDRLKQIGAVDKSEVEFYFMRYIVWYLLFVGRKSEYEPMVSEFIKTFDWLKTKFPNFLKNENLSLFHPKGETLRNRFVVSCFIALYKLGLLPFFFRIYSRG
ncbi:MAG: glycosyltransferase [Candidatus Moraniibacteriota bacterium]